MRLIVATWYVDGKEQVWGESVVVSPLEGTLPYLQGEHLYTEDFLLMLLRPMVQDATAASSCNAV